MKVWRLLLLSAALLWSGGGCADPGITVNRSIFGPNGEKWCADVKDWKFVQIDPLNCGDCNQPCPLNHACFKSKCEPSASSNNSNNSGEISDCSYYLQCVYSGCAVNCQEAADCLEVEQACADEEQTSIQEMRDNGYVALQCNVTTGRCYVEKPEPPDDDDDEDPPVTPPPSTNKTDTCCGSACSDCTDAGKSCEGAGSTYACVCNGCEDNGQCYDVGYRRSFPEKPGYECGASCKCLADKTWGECTPLSNCPI